MLDWIGRVVVTHVCEYECVKYVCARRLEKQINVTVHWQCGIGDGETKKVLKRVQMYIDEILEIVY